MAKHFEFLLAFGLLWWVPETVRASNPRLPADMKFECKFPLGRAQHLERLMRRARSPEQSIWKKEYCLQLCRARQAGCTRINEYLEHQHMCPSKKDCQ